MYIEYEKELISRLLANKVVVVVVLVSVSFTFGFEVLVDVVVLCNLKVLNISFSCADFGGQSYYYNTHKLFLSSDAVYVVVFDARKLGKDVTKLDTSRLFQWLDTLIRYAAGKCFFFVA